MPNSENAEESAKHYLSSDNPADAIPYLIEAARQADYRCAYDTVIKHYRKALTLFQEQFDGREKEYYEARIGLSKALKFNGNYNEARLVLTETLARLKNWKAGAEFSIFKPNLAIILRELGDIRQREGAFDDALEYMDSGLDILNDESSLEISKLIQTINDRIAWIFFQQGELEKSFKTVHSAIESLGREDTDPATLASLHNTKGGISCQQGKNDEAIADTELSLKLYQGINNPRGMGIAFTNLGILNDINGNWPRAIDYYERAHELQKSIGDLENQARSLENLGALRMAIGNHKETRRVLLSALEIREKLGDKPGKAHSRASFAQQALIEKEFDEASSNAAMALELSKSVGSKETEVYALWVLAMVQAETDDLEKGLANAKKASQMARSGGLIDEEINCLRIVGILQARNGDISAAKHSLQDSIKLARLQMDPYRVALAHIELGKIYLNQYETEEPKLESTRRKAADSIQDAIAIFEALGATRNLKAAIVLKI